MQDREIVISQQHECSRVMAGVHGTERGGQRHVRHLSVVRRLVTEAGHAPIIAEAACVVQEIMPMPAAIYPRPTSAVSRNVWRVPTRSRAADAKSSAVRPQSLRRMSGAPCSMK